MEVPQETIDTLVSMADDIINTMMMDGPGATPPIALALAHTIKNNFDD